MSTPTPQPSPPETLLPPASTPLERALSRTLGRFDPPRVIPTLWNADTCPASLLPYLAWAMAVDEWDHGWSVEKKRAVVREQRAIHKSKGTPASIRRALAAIGQPDAEIIERADCVKRNGTAPRTGIHRRRGLDGWASYRVVLKRAVTVDQAYQIKRLLAATQRNCVHLIAIDFSAAAIRRNGTARRDGSFTRGVVNTRIE